MEKYVVELTSEERKELSELVSKGKAAARKITHARVLLQADESKNGSVWTGNLGQKVVEYSNVKFFKKWRQIGTILSIPAVIIAEFTVSKTL